MTVCSVTRSKVKVTSPWKSEIWPFLKAIFPFIMGAGKWTRILKLGTIPKSYRGRIFVLFLCHMTLKLAVSRSRLPVLYKANLLLYGFRWVEDGMTLSAAMMSCGNKYVVSMDLLLPEVLRLCQAISNLLNLALGAP